MRYSTLLTIILIGMVTQSCRITIPSLIEINGVREVYDFRKSRALKAQSGFKDTLIIGDNPESVHGRRMHLLITAKEWGVPENNIVFLDRFDRHYSDSHNNVGLQELTSGNHKTLYRASRIVHIPYAIPLKGSQDASRVMDTNILFILPALNMHESFNGDRDTYSPGHIIWREPYWQKGGSFSYENVIDAYNTGKVIAATSAVLTDAGTIEPNEEVVSCGNIKESCFTMMPKQTTSNASARLVPVSFYLAQFWETPEEIIEVLKECAIDVGEPGVDHEYGNGIVNLLCPRVLKKEIEVVSKYLEDTGERGEILKGGDLEGIWKAENTALQVYIPQALKSTVQIGYQGTVRGAVEFEESRVKADITTEAAIQIDFLKRGEAIEATAEDDIRFEEVYTVDQGNTVNIPAVKKSFTYTATKDSLHLVKSFSLNEILAVLPNPLGSMVSRASEDFFADDPIQIRMSFSKVEPLLLGDFNEDGAVDVADFLLFVDAFGSYQGDKEFDEKFDVVPDGMISIADFLLFMEQFEKTRDS